ncbi:MAG: antitoxin PrlF [Natronomonas sp.]|jgi:antitoxin PrlF|uniref:AbrB/MazE/SpoVT family DNA-binding domain-containing protein n=1 Tax=Natronomonas sp. TaxID=2184060 RepID=UPI0039895BED
MSFSQDATVTSKGQVTIPKEIRDRLGIESGTEVEFEVQEDGSVTIRPKKPAMERLQDIRKQLSEHDVDLEKMRRESKRAWSSHESGEESA